MHQAWHACFGNREWVCDLSIQLADWVGSTGRIVGIDQSGDAIAAAEKRVRLMTLKNVSFQHASAETFSAPETFDVAIARFVLMHQANPIEVLSAAARSVKSGGVVAIVNQIRHAQHFVLALAFRYLIRQSTA
jgi:ubiquinone/menaquinone biosynthesis C-methylase UbiE